MSYYLPKEIKFAMAFVGILTLIYVNFLQVKTSDTSKVLDPEQDVVNQNKKVVVLQHSTGDELNGYYAVGNALAYSNALNYDFEILDKETWNVDLKRLIIKYPEGVILFDGSIRESTNEVVNLPLSKAQKTRKPQSKEGKVVGLTFTQKDLSLLENSCGVMERNENDPVIITSALAACHKLKNGDGAIILDEKGVYEI